MVGPITLYCQLNSWHCLLLFLFLSSPGFGLHCSSFLFFIFTRFGFLGFFSSSPFTGFGLHFFLFFFFFPYSFIGFGFLGFSFFFFFFCSSSHNFLVWSCTPWPGKDGFGFGFGVSKYLHEWFSKYPFLEHGGWGFGMVSQPRPWMKILHWFCIGWWTKTVDEDRHRIGSVLACHRRRPVVASWGGGGISCLIGCIFLLLLLLLLFLLLWLKLGSGLCFGRVTGVKEGKWEKRKWWGPQNSFALIKWQVWGPQIV